MNELEFLRAEVARLTADNEKLRRLTVIDPLTGLYNRRHAEDKLDYFWSMFERYSDTFSVLSLDLDHFKSINDTYGHDVGDEVLVSFSKILSDTIRIGDFAIRMGGEEFLVIAPRCDQDNAKILGDRIVQEVYDNQPSHLNIQQKITVSVGTSTTLKWTSDAWHELLKNSDTALYKAKENGRNRCESF
jgi:diguanylate cyclase (GGDEF)-like protein